MDVQSESPNLCYKLIELIDLHEAKALIESIQWAHDIVLYHSDVVLDSKEKAKLFRLMELHDLLSAL